METNNIISVIIGTFIGILLKACFDKIKNRLFKLKYKVYHSYLGATESDPYFGTIEILYNKIPVRNLFMSKLILLNDGAKDIDQFELNIKCDPNSMIIVSQGYKHGSVKELEFSDSYKTKLNNRNNPTVLLFRDYIIPSINRGEIIEVSMLVTNSNGIQPFIMASTEKAGLNISQSKVFQEFYGEPIIQTALLGIILSIILCIPIILFIEDKILSVILSLVIGLFALLLGLLSRKVIRLLIRLLS